MNITVNIPENSVDSATVAGKKITVYFPVQENTVITVLEKGVLFGIQGAAGPGVAAGGATGQVLKKNSNFDYDTIWGNLDKASVGLGNVDNTSDLDKPISNAVQIALNLKEGVITSGTIAQYWRGDKTFQTLDKTAVGLSNVDNTSDANKPISNATQTALNAKQSTISLTTTGASGAATLASNVLNIPNYTLSGLGGQPLNANLTSISALTYASTSFVKMTAAGTFALDTNTYLTSESDTLASVTGRGATTTNAISVGSLTSNGSITASSSLARGNYINNTLVASANNDILVGLDINPTFNTGSFTPVARYALRILNGNIDVANGTNLTIGGVTAINFGNALTLLSRGLSQNINFQLGGGTQVGQFTGTTGNLLLQNGGTFTDAGYRLDVNGTTRLNGLQTFQGTTASDSAQLGSELLTTGTGTNWTGTGFSTGYTHTTGSTATLTSTLAAVVGNLYQIAYTITGRTAGSVSIDFGGATTSGITATGSTGPKATTTGTVVITPTTDFDGTLVLSIKIISVSSAITTWKNSSGTNVNELRTNTNNNLFLGLNSGYYTTNGSNNVGISINALNSNTTGINNIGIGTNTLNSNTIGASNISVGTNALNSNILGSQNIGIGESALFSATSSSFNIAIGRTAFLNLTSGNDNVAIGITAGRFIADLVTNLTSSNSSIFIGNSSRPLANSQTNQIVIGSSAVGLGSNTTVLGNSSTVTTALYGNLLLGTTTATGAGLTVSSSITASSAIARGVYFNPTLTAAANNDVLVGLDINPTLNTGSFTGISQYALRVVGNMVMSTGTYLIMGYNSTGSTSEQILFSGGRSWIGFDTATSGLNLGSVSTRTISFGLGNSGASTTYGRFFATTGNFLLQNGGTFTDAGYRLDVNGTVRIQNVLTLGSLSADPTGANGMIYYNTTSNTFKVYQNGAWKTITAI